MKVYKFNNSEKFKNIEKFNNSEEVDKYFIVYYYTKRNGNLVIGNGVVEGDLSNIEEPEDLIEMIKEYDAGAESAEDVAILGMSKIN